MISRVDFSCLSPEKIRNISVCEVTKDELYDNGKPMHGGLRDPRFGVSSRRGVCTACSRTWTNCSGHFGHFELPHPVYHIGWMPEVLYWLRRICHQCGFTNGSLSGKKCSDCKTPIAKFSRINSMTLRISDKDGLRDLHAQEAMTILSKVSAEHMKKIRPDGFHPSWLILTVLPIPPNCVRPSPTRDGDEVRGEDDITRRLLYILRVCKGYTRIKHENSAVIQHYQKKVQDAVHMYIDQTRMSTKNKGTQKCISDRLRGKTGRLRGTLMGKRCNFTARTVISGDAMLDMREVGIPQEVADKLTIVENINRLNFTSIRDMIAKQDPRIKCVIKKDGTRLDMATVKGQVNIECGCSVERTLRNGDLVLFNRQPSLHRMSIMCHKARILKGKTFRLNLTCTTPYNADFDGDEMNLHVLQTHESRADAIELMSVAKNIITPQSNKPVMGIVQDSLLSAFMMTSPGVILDKSEMCNIMMWIEDVNELQEPKIETDQGMRWSGLQCMSMLFPKDFNWKDYIFKGQLLKGPLGKKALGRSHGSIIHRLYNDYGPDRTCQFINELQRINHIWFSTQGFSIGIGDMRISDETAQKVRNECANIDNLAEDIRKNSSVPEPNINRMLNQTRDSMGLIAQNSMSKDNCLGLMVKSGSKGSMVNILQIMACVGQQNCQGKRIQPTLGGRTLPMFEKDDDSARARGFVKHSYIDGLTPDEYWNHTVGGREGLVDTAVKTSTTGYIQRRLVKSLESIHVANDGSVRDAQNCIIQFKYGEDGRDGMAHEMISCSFDTMDILDNTYDIKKWPELENAFKMWKWTQKSKLCDNWAITVPVQRILDKYKDGGSISNAKIRQIIMPLLQATDENPLTRAYILSVFAKKDIHCSPKSLTLIIEKLLIKWHKSIVAPGEMVGTIAAQSLGEPTTQMTLNTFHNAGNSAKNVTLGVPRLEELLNASSKIKTPSLTIYTDEVSTQSPQKAWKLKTELQRSQLKDIVREKSYEAKIHSQLQEYLQCPDNTRWEFNPTPKRILHCILDRKKMIQRNIQLQDIIQTLRDMNMAKHIAIGYHDDIINDPHLFMKTKRDKNFFQYAKQSLDATVKGSKYIPSVNIRIEGKQFVIDTEGIDLNHVKNIKCVNQKTIECNDIFAIKQTYGIEAARATLLREMHAVLYSYGIYVNMRHLMTIVDWMTFEGNITALTRHGVKKRMKTNAPLKRATFEQPVEIFHNAAVKGFKDDVQGISEQLLMGIEPRCGSRFNMTVTDKNYKKKWDEDDWQPPEEEEEEEEDLFGPLDVWRPTQCPDIEMPDSSWDSHTTFANVQNAPIPQPQQPAWQQPQQPAWQQPQQPAWQQPQQPAWQQPQQPAWQQPQQPAWQQPQQPAEAYSPASPAYSPASPAYSPASPAYSPASPAYSPKDSGVVYSPASPAYSPASPAYSPASPAYSPKDSGMAYSPASPAYSPKDSGMASSPASPAYSPSYNPGTTNDESPNKRQKK